MEFVAVDLGASSTRYITKEGKIRFLPNNATFIPEIEAELDNPKSDEIVENNLDVTFIKEEPNKFFPMRVLVGEMANRFSYGMETPNQIDSKVEQRINYMSAVLSVAISKLRNDDMSEDIQLFVALPPLELLENENKEEFINLITGKYKVTFNRVGTEGKTVEFNIVTVDFRPESQLAVMQFIYGDSDPKKVAMYGNRTILSLDIGASTTDAVLFDNGKYLEKTGCTWKIGGNTVRQHIVRKVSSKLKIRLENDGADMAIIEGRIPYGNEYIEIKEIVEAAKREVADELIAKIREYIPSSGIALTSINYIIVSGGGSMESSYVDGNGEVKKTSNAMSSYITDALKQHCSGISVVQFSDEPRLANIRGLGLVAMMLSKKQQAVK